MSHRQSFLSPVATVLALSAGVLTGCGDSEGLANARAGTDSASAPTAVGYPGAIFAAP